MFFIFQSSLFYHLNFFFFDFIKFLTIKVYSLIDNELRPFFFNFIFLVFYFVLFSFPQYISCLMSWIFSLLVAANLFSYFFLLELLLISFDFIFISRFRVSYFSVQISYTILFLFNISIIYFLSVRLLTRCFWIFNKKKN